VKRADAKDRTEPRRAFKRVLLVEAPAMHSKALVIRARNGVGIGGLSLDDVVALLSRLP
jgi:hypothetical protein